MIFGTSKREKEISLSDLHTNLDVRRAFRTSVQRPNLLSHCSDKLIIQPLPPILWQHIFGQPSLDCHQLPPSPNSLPRLTIPVPIPTPHDWNARQLLRGWLESAALSFRLGKLHAADMEPFRAVAAVMLRVQGGTVHLLASAC